MLEDIEPVLDLLAAQTESGVLIAEEDGRLLYLNDTARTLLRVMEKEPDAVLRVLAAA